MSVLFSLRAASLALLSCALLGACSRTAPAPEPVRTVKLLTVAAHTLAPERLYAAQVQARTEARLGFQVAGKVLRRSAELGQEVRAGQELAQLDPQDYALSVQAAQAQLQAAQTQRDLAQADWQRFSALAQEGFISPVELDRRRASLQAAQAQWQQAQAQAQVQGNQSRYTHLRSDAAGVVTGVHAEPGQVVAAGTPVVTVALDGPRDAVFAVPEDAQQQVPIGQAVQVLPWAGQAPLAGVVREVAASADPVTRTFLVKVALLAEQAPALGSTVQVQVPLAPAQDALTLPSTAVWQRPDGAAAVWLFDPQQRTVHAQVVELGPVQGNVLTVRSGLQPGQQVVAAGTHVLSEGQQVQVFTGKGA